MKLSALTGFLCLAALGLAQDIQFDYDRSANFSSYKTYTWVDLKAGRAANQLMDQNIKRSVDEQLVGKGLQRVASGGDLQVAYQMGIDHEKQFDGWGMGPRGLVNGRVTSSSVDIGKLTVDIYDLGRKQLVWHGAAEKTLDIKKDPDKNYQNLEKAMAKLFRNYPPQSGRK